MLLWGRGKGEQENMLKEKKFSGYWRISCRFWVHILENWERNYNEKPKKKEEKFK